MILSTWIQGINCKDGAQDLYSVFSLLETITMYILIQTALGSQNLQPEMKEVLGHWGIIA